MTTANKVEGSDDVNKFTLIREGLFYPVGFFKFRTYVFLCLRLIK